MIENYQAPNPTYWQGRDDLPPRSTFFQVMKLINLLDKNSPISPSHQLAFGLVGFCCDEGIRRNFGRLGAAKGPGAIRHALATLPIQRSNVVCYDAGDIICENGNLELAQRALSFAVNQLLQRQIIPIVLGGGHELAWGTYQGIVNHYPKEYLSIVNFDAHFDMRPLLSQDKGSSGTPFLQIAKAETLHKQFNYYCIGIQQTGNIQALFDTAKHYQVKVIFADELHQAGCMKYAGFIDHIISKPHILYVSLCLDVFASAYAPGVSAPQSLGLNPWQVIPFIRKLASSGKVVSYDIAEMSPPFDIDDRTAKLAASFIYEIIHHHLAMHGNSG